MSWRKFICDYKAVRKLYCICYLIKRKKKTTPSKQFQYLIGICRNRDKIDTIKTHLYVPLVVSTSRSFPHSWLITGVKTRLTRWESLVEQELPPFGALEFTAVFNGGSCYSIFSFMYMFCRSLFVPLSFIFLAIVLSVLLRITDSNYPFDIFKLFLHSSWSTIALNKLLNN